MLQFILRRLVLLLPVLVGILLFTFIITRMIKGDPCVVMLGEKATKQQCDMFKERYGLNDNVLVQFGRYILNIAQGDFGTTIKDRRPVVDVMAERLPMTIEITVGAMLFSTTFGVLLGIFAALRRNSALDVGTMMVANVGVSMPVFWLGQILAYTFALLLKGTIFYLPPSSRLSASMSLMPLATLWHLDNLGGLAKFLISMISNSAILNGILTGNFLLVKDALWHLILPCAAVGTIPMAIIARMTRSSLLDVLGQDYVRTARAKGLVQRLVVTRHALRNALIPIVTIIGLETGVLLSGAVLTETIFSLPGVGTRMVDAILSRDYPVIQGFTILIALIFVVTNLVVDISYAFLDPRIRLE